MLFLVPFGSRERKPSCTAANWGGTGAEQVLDGASDSWETSALRTKDLCALS